MHVETVTYYSLLIPRMGPLDELWGDKYSAKGQQVEWCCSHLFTLSISHWGTMARPGAKSTNKRGSHMVFPFGRTTWTPLPVVCLILIILITETGIRCTGNLPDLSWHHDLSSAAGIRQCDSHFPLVFAALDDLICSGGTPSVLDPGTFDHVAIPSIGEYPSPLFF